MIKTVIIAADDSSTTGKELVDYVYDGSNKIKVDGLTRGGIMHVCTVNYSTVIDEIGKLRNKMK